MKRIFDLLFLLLILSLSATGQNDAFIKQQNGLINSEINLTQYGGNNLLTGYPSTPTPVQDATGQFHNAAYQFSQAGVTNFLTVKQVNSIAGTNKIYLHQNAMQENKAILEQINGSHTLKLHEVALGGSNKTHIRQMDGSGYIHLEREAGDDNIIPSPALVNIYNPWNFPGILQKGVENNIYGVALTPGPDLVPQPGLPARQLNHSGTNQLIIWQRGGHNTVGLYQNAWKDNTAIINQQHGYNEALIYQNNSGGSNFLMLHQAGGKSAKVYQNSISGSYNFAIIVQY